MKKQLTKFALSATFGLALVFTQVTVFAQQQYPYPPQYPPPQGQYQYPPPQEQYQYPPQEQYQYPPQEQPVEQPIEQQAAPTSNATSRKNSFTFDEFILFKGFTASRDKVTITCMSIGYERLMVPHFSLGADFDMYIGAVTGASSMLLYFGFLSEGRYYTDAEFEKFFVGTTLGLNLLSVDGTSEDKGGFIGLTSSLKMGYKIVFFESSYVEPSMSYVLSKSGRGNATMPTPLGWQGGLRLGYSF